LKGDRKREREKERGSCRWEGKAALLLCWPPAPPR
jgi:hypothetical protein